MKKDSEYVVKAPLKRMFQDLLPKPIIARKKVGFPVPLSDIFGFDVPDGKTFMDEWLRYNVKSLTGDNDLYSEVLNSI